MYLSNEFNKKLCYNIHAERGIPMKEMIVLSDSHLHNDIVKNIIHRYPNIHECIHCGDLQDDYHALSQLTHLTIVRGNNDYNDLPLIDFLSVSNHKIMICHGHYQNVEDTDYHLIEEAKKNKCNFICYGHTHDPTFYQREGIYILNPGSVAFPRGGHVFVPSYAIVLFEDVPIVNFYHAKTHECINHLVFENIKQEKKSFFAFFKRKH